ncbi:MAG: Ribonuclease HIII [Candidatus Thorarchaeota archaeon AB_25]|nr:MAG: Ribonuclease HIII [Candidatus Thorarchaeota archaeon AB_25]
MKPTVVKVDPDQIENLHGRLLDSKDSSDLATKSEYEAFRIMFAGEAIIGYTSGKIVSNGPHSAAAVQNAILEMTPNTVVPLVIGSDEAGKGEWLGPMTVAAVALTPEQTAMMRALGVMDSKSMSVVRISELSKTVRRNALKVESLLISPETFNSQIEEFRKEGKNLNDMLAWAHTKVISEVYETIRTRDEPIKIVVDQFARVKTEARLRGKLDLGTIELVQRPKAEDEIAVAAASIIAREAREAWIDWACEKFGYDLRELSVREAYDHANKNTFAKTTYLQSEIDRKS